MTARASGYMGVGWWSCGRRLLTSILRNTRVFSLGAGIPEIICTLVSSENISETVELSLWHGCSGGLWVWLLETYSFPEGVPVPTDNRDWCVRVF